jgi:Immunity protein family (Imm11)
MTTAPTKRRTRKAKARKFHLMSPDFTKGGRAGFEVQNLAALLDGRRVLGPPIGKRGFGNFDEAAKVLVDKSLGRALRDLELYHEYWLVSDKLKTALEAVDPDGVVFVKCDVWNCDGTAGPVYWLCDVVRVLDAVDEGSSRVKVENRTYQGQPWKGYSLLGGASLIFREDVVGSAHIFRMRYLTPQVICDQDVGDACKRLGLRSIRFQDAANYLGY